MEDTIASTPGLSVSRLKRGGYVLDAQRSTTRKNIGYFILCPDGPAQSAAIEISPWYTAVQEAQLQRGFSNLAWRK